MTVGFYGFGHLAKAIARGMIEKKLFEEKDLFILAKSSQTMQDAEKKGFRVCDDAKALFDRCDTVILAVKPLVFFEIAHTLRALDLKGKRVVSVMASVGLEQLKEVFDCPVLRMMPTIAIKTGNDVIGMTDPEGFEDFEILMHRLGRVLILEEERLDCLTVAASCGPGFAASILCAYASACRDLGFSEKEAVNITSAVFSFAAGSTEGENPFEQLVAQVATKGGVTEAGNTAMEPLIHRGIQEAFQCALDRASAKKN